MEVLKNFINSLLTNPRSIEIIIRTLCVLVISEGGRVTFRMIMHSILKAFGVGEAKRKKLVKGWSESFGILINIGISCLAAYVYAEGKGKTIIWFEGLAYGFATVFIHYNWVKYDITAKIFNGIKLLWNALADRVRGFKKKKK